MRITIFLLMLLELLILQNSLAFLSNNSSLQVVDKVHHQSSAPPDTVQIAGNIWDPNSVATKEEIDKFRDKGNFLACLLDMTDEEAGKAWPDPWGRTPKSASSVFKGTLEGKLLGSNSLPLRSRSNIYTQQASLLHGPGRKLAMATPTASPKTAIFGYTRRSTPWGSAPFLKAKVEIIRAIQLSISMRRRRMKMAMKCRITSRRISLMGRSIM